MANAAAALTALAMGKEVGPGIVSLFEECIAGNGYHHLKVGFPSACDKIIWTEEFRYPGKYFGYRRHTVNPTPQHLKGATITSIVCLDLWSDDTGGSAVIQRGGVNFVEIQFTSLWFRGFHFKIVITGITQRRKYTSTNKFLNENWKKISSTDKMDRQIATPQTSTVRGAQYTESDNAGNTATLTVWEKSTGN